MSPNEPEAPDDSSPAGADEPTEHRRPFTRTMLRFPRRRRLGPPVRGIPDETIISRLDAESARRPAPLSALELLRRAERPC